MTTQKQHFDNPKTTQIATKVATFVFKYDYPGSWGEIPGPGSLFFVPPKYFSGKNFDHSLPQNSYQKNNHTQK